MNVVKSPGPPLGPPAGPVAAPPVNGRVDAAANRHSARLKDTARQFEAMFMTEMLRHARPDSKPSGPFAAGQAEGTWRTLMDQALGQAAAREGPAGDGRLRQAIEKSLRDAENRHGRGGVR
jgi:Rod binding domain-containing protein